jgi:hypothetical protein
MSRVRGLIEEGLREGEFQGLEPELTACLLFGMIHVRSGRDTKGRR